MNQHLTSARRRLHLEPLEERCLLATIVVDSLADNTTSGDGLTTLREALAAADDSDVVEFAPALFASGPQVLTLSEGELEIEAAIEVIGPGAASLTIDASGNDPTPVEMDSQGTRVLRIRDSGFFDAPVTIRGLTLTGGDTDLRGGAIRTEEPLTLEDSVLIGNHSGQNGGGIYADKRLDLIRTTVAGSKGLFGGGIYSNSSVVMTDSLVNENESHFDGGGIFITDATLTITGGQVNGNRSREFEDGGGVYAVDTTALINEAQFVANSAGGSGGGYYLQGGRLTFNGGEFTGNEARNSSGGGVYAEQATNVTLTDVVVGGNDAAVDGGGLFANFVSIVSLQSSTLRHNQADSLGGGLYLRNVFSASVKQSLVDHNTADSKGGGLMIDRDSGISITSSTISGNSSFLGGGLYIDDGNATIHNSTISDNIANTGGGVGIRNTDRLNIRHSTLTQNLATGDGGGVATTGVDVSFFYSTITQNQADADGDSEGAGGGLFASDGASIVLSNAIAADNHDNGDGPDVYLFPSFDDPTLSTRYSLLGTNEGNDRTETLPGVADALGSFIGGPTNGPINPLLGPLRDNGGPTHTHALLPSSIAIDAGEVNIQFPPDFDQRGEGFPRFVNGGGGVQIDMGAFESQGVPSFADGDFNQSGAVDAGDYTTWRDGLGDTYTVEYYLVWKANYGAGLVTTPVEPASTSAALFASPADFTNKRTNESLVTAKAAEATAAAFASDDLPLLLRAERQPSDNAAEENADFFPGKTVSEDNPRDTFFSNWDDSTAIWVLV